MTSLRLIATVALLLHVVAGGRTSAQSATPAPAPPPAAVATAGAPVPPLYGPLNRMTIVLDPAHGGIDGGSRIGDGSTAMLEKDVTLAFAFRLRSLLVARGFTVVMTRDSDAAVRPGSPGIELSLDDRAGIANHARASACLLLHATGSGNGVHLYSSDLDAVGMEANHLPWLTAQSAWVAGSRALEQAMAAALTRAKLPLVASHASVRPVDSMTCPALVVELAPEGDEPDSINDSGYQQRVAEALAGALVFWPRQFQPPTLQPRAVKATPTATPAAASPTVTPATPEGQP